LTIPTFAYTPATGFSNTTTFPNPASGAAARLQLMVPLDQITTHLNALKAIFEAVTDGASGADHVAATTIAGLTGNTVQALLENIVTGLKAVTDSASGADFVGATAIDGLTGATVQALLENIMTVPKAVTDGSSGADVVGTTAITGVTGATVQAQLESLKGLIDAVVLGGIPDDSITDAKLSTAAGAILDVVTAHTAATADMQFLTTRGVRYIG